MFPRSDQRFVKLLAAMMAAATFPAIVPIVPPLSTLIAPLMGFAPAIVTFIAPIVMGFSAIVPPVIAPIVPPFPTFIAPLMGFATAIVTFIAPIVAGFPPVPIAMAWANQAAQTGDGAAAASGDFFRSPLLPPLTGWSPGSSFCGISIIVILLRQQRCGPGPARQLARLLAAGGSAAIRTDRAFPAALIREIEWLIPLFQRSRR
jgi:hypothetical protein